MSFRHLDLFSGIGGFTLAAQLAGFETAGFAEVEPYCCQLLAERFPGIHNYGDIRTADFSRLRGRITVLSAGVPCQPASLAGKRRGSKDDRWLWPAVLDVVERVEPSWCLFENPPGLLSLGEFDRILLRLAEAGYEVRAFSVPAAALGAHHLRYRVFIVAYSGRQAIDSYTDRTGLPQRVNDASGSNGRAYLGRMERRVSQSPLCVRFDGFSEGLDRIGQIDENCKRSARKILYPLWNPDVEESLQWTLGRFNSLHPAEILLHVLLRIEQDQIVAHGGGFEKARAKVSDYIVREVWIDIERFRASPGRRPDQQLCTECWDALRKLSYEAPSLYLEAWKNGDWMNIGLPLCSKADRIRNRAQRLRALGNAVVPQQALPFFEAIYKTEAMFL